MNKYYFTFGYKHLSEDGKPLHKHYVLVEAETESIARGAMFTRFEHNWASVYDNADIVEQNKLKLYEHIVFTIPTRTLKLK